MDKTYNVLAIKSKTLNILGSNLPTKNIVHLKIIPIPIRAKDYTGYRLNIRPKISKLRLVLP